MNEGRKAESLLLPIPCVGFPNSGNSAKGVFDPRAGCWALRSWWASFPDWGPLFSMRPAR